MNAVEVLPAIAVFQGAIMKDCAMAALDSPDVESMRGHVQMLKRQLDELLRLARRAVAEQNGETVPDEG